MAGEENLPVDSRKIFTIHPVRGLPAPLMNARRKLRTGKPASVTATQAAAFRISARPMSQLYIRLRVEERPNNGNAPAGQTT